MIVSEVKDSIKIVKDIGASLGVGGKPRDNVLIRTRDNIFNLFRAKGISPDVKGSPINLAVEKNGMSHAKIPNEKPVGQDYNPEFQRLWQMVIDTFTNMGREDLAKNFRNNVPVYTINTHPIDYVSTLLNGSSSPVSVAAGEARYSILEPIKPIMREALISQGFTAPSNTEDLAQLFYNKFVAVKNSYNYEPGEEIDFLSTSPKHHLDEAVVEAILAYVKSLKDQKSQGVQLPKVLDKIAVGAGEVEQTLKEKAGQQVKSDIGGFITDNAGMLIIALLVVFGLIIWLVSRK